MFQTRFPRSPAHQQVPLPWRVDSESAEAWADWFVLFLTSKDPDRHVQLKAFTCMLAQDLAILARLARRWAQGPAMALLAQALLHGGGCCDKFREALSDALKPVAARKLWNELRQCRWWAVQGIFDYDTKMKLLQVEREEPQQQQLWRVPRDAGMRVQALVGDSSFGSMRQEDEEGNFTYTLPYHLLDDGTPHKLTGLHARKQLLAHLVTGSAVRQTAVLRQEVPLCSCWNLTVCGALRGLQKLIRSSMEVLQQAPADMQQEMALLEANVARCVAALP